MMIQPQGDGIDGARIEVRSGLRPVAGRAICLATTLATLLVGCAPGADYVSPQFPFFARYQAAPGAPILLDNIAWWTRMNDPALDQLIRLALRDNLTLAVARTRAEVAQATRDSVPGAAVLSPSASARITGSDGDSSTSAPLRIGLDWMLDPSGARRSQLQAQDAQVDIARAEIDAARLLLIGNVASAYLDLRYSQQSLALARAELASRQRTLSVTRALSDSGEATRLELTRAEARIAEIRSDLPGLDAAITATLNQISVLTGSTPGTLPPTVIGPLQATSSQPIPALSPEVGIPADLLRNRPDIAIAERRYAAAVAEIGVAQAAQYPSLSLSGAITLDALDGGVDYFFGPALTLPDPFGGAQAAVAARHAAARAAFGEWRGTVLQAILEVENALVAYDAATNATQAARDAVRLYSESLSLTRTLYAQGETTIGDLIDAESAVATAENRLASLRLQRAQAFVDLNLRLGAGHSVGTPDQPADQPADQPVIAAGN